MKINNIKNVNDMNDFRLKYRTMSLQDVLNNKVGTWIE